ncbi:HAD family hydrolase [Pectobacterium odoriferum]|uniref:HAD family hydrolase n=1 Tax=Pectobacterium odoriferum TaxID=78398 RepID=UPI000CD2D5C0|nr:HAD-IA family hydrolase [Pectobacterium odoriferum]POE18054.1 HAD family hydrolase [Pectobacterium odoriferum]
MNVKAVIFDMDGVIIDSEPLWCQAQIEAMAKWGVSVTSKECENLTRGKRLDEIAMVWCSRYALPVAPAVLEDAILCRITDLISTKGEAMKGVYDILEYFRHLGFKIALATSSSHQVIEAVFNKLNLWRYFNVISSAEDELQGKPHPAVYLSALRKLNLSAADCLVVEDSLNGFHAAQAAGIRTTVVSPDYMYPHFQAATGRYYSLHHLLTALVNPPLTVAKLHAHSE